MKMENYNKFPKKKNIINFKTNDIFIIQNLKNNLRWENIVFLFFDTIVTIFSRSSTVCPMLDKVYKSKYHKKYR